MTEIEKLLSLVGSENLAEAKTLADAVNEKVRDLDTQISQQEAMKIEAVKSRDQVVAKLKQAASELGVSETDNLNEAIQSIRSKKSSGKADDVAAKEIEQLKLEIANANSSFENERLAHKEQLLSVALEKDIATTLPKYKAKVAATKYIIDAVKQKAEFADGKIVFKNNDGTTLRVNGNDATLDDVIKEMQCKEKSENESMFFDISPQDSGAGNSLGGNKAQQDFIP